MLQRVNTPRYVPRSRLGWDAHRDYIIKPAWRLFRAIAITLATIALGWYTHPSWEYLISWEYLTEEDSTLLIIFVLLFLGTILCWYRIIQQRD